MRAFAESFGLGFCPGPGFPPAAPIAPPLRRWSSNLSVCFTSACVIQRDDWSSISTHVDRSASAVAGAAAVVAVAIAAVVVVVVPVPVPVGEDMSRATV